MSRFVRSSQGNFNWCLNHTKHLLNEFRFRRNKEHSYLRVLNWVVSNPLKINENNALTVWPRCFGDYKSQILITEDVTKDYQEYYKIAKSRFASWTNRPKPQWFDKIEKPN
jgi:hypothetical protein